MQYLRLFFLGALTLASKNLAADPIKESTVHLAISPEVCISDKPQGVCYEAIRVSWRSKADISACLFIGAKAKAVRCWQGLKYGEHIIKIHSKRTLAFVLKHLDSSAVLAKKQLSVLKVKRKSRRRRHAWSIF